jgi:predicted Fe-S protein YdhL (DUF1289 family)
MNPRTGWCEGCLRTIEEIADWSRMEDHEKRAVWQRLDQRRRAAGVTPPEAP